MADRALHAARAAGRPFLADADLAVSWLGDRGFFTNVACVLPEPGDWDGVVERIGRIVPAGRPVSLVSPWSRAAARPGDVAAWSATRR